jgi:ParB family chromosome partitioning protein
MTREELENKITRLKVKKKLHPKEQWELKKLKKDLEKLDATVESEPTGIFINDDSYQLIDISKITTNPYQNRTRFDEERIKELAESIEEIGLLQPVVVAKNGDEYILVSGERRLRAYTMLKREKIPTLLKYNLSNSDLEEMALVENLAREDIDIYDEVVAIAKLINRGLSYSAIATKIGKSKTHISRMNAINSIDKELLIKLAQNGIYKPKLLELIAKKEIEEQTALVDKLIDGNLTLKELEKEKVKKEPTTKEVEYICSGVEIKSKSKDKLTLTIDLNDFDYDSIKNYLKELKV